MFFWLLHIKSSPLVFSASISQKPFTVDHSLHQALAGAPLCKAGGLWFSGQGQEEKGVAQTEVGCGGERVALHSFFIWCLDQTFFSSTSLLPCQAIRVPHPLVKAALAWGNRGKWHGEISNHSTGLYNALSHPLVSLSRRSLTPSLTLELVAVICHLQLHLLPPSDSLS